MLLFLRGAGNLAYFYAGVWRALCWMHDEERKKKGSGANDDSLANKCHDHDAAVGPGPSCPAADLNTSQRYRSYRFQGISSGALMSTLIACDIPLEYAIKVFDTVVQRVKVLLFFSYLIRVNQGQGWLRRRLGSLGLLGWNTFLLETRCRYMLVPIFLRTLIDDDRLKRLCPPGKLRIVAFSLTDMTVVSNSTWHSVDHLVEWVLAAMAIPSVTSWPRKVQSKWLTDAFQFDTWWPRNPIALDAPLHHYEDDHCHRYQSSESEVEEAQAQLATSSSSSSRTAAEWNTGSSYSGGGARSTTAVIEASPFQLTFSAHLRPPRGYFWTLMDALGPTNPRRKAELYLAGFCAVNRHFSHGNSTPVMTTKPRGFMKL